MDTDSVPTREELIEKAQSIVDESQLEDFDKEMWHERFEELEDPAISLFIDMMAVEPDLLEIVTENVKKKVEAGDDVEKIKTIVEEEKDMLQAAFNL